MAKISKPWVQPADYWIKHHVSPYTAKYRNDKLPIECDSKLFLMIGK